MTRELQTINSIRIAKNNRMKYEDQKRRKKKWIINLGENLTEDGVDEVQCGLVLRRIADLAFNK